MVLLSLYPQQAQHKIISNSIFSDTTSDTRPKYLSL